MECGYACLNCGVALKVIKLGLLCNVLQLKTQRSALTCIVTYCATIAILEDNIFCYQHLSICCYRIIQCLIDIALINLRNKQMNITETVYAHA